MPTLGALTTSVYRDLADEAKEVFSVLQIEDFIRHGVAELNRIAPQDVQDSPAWPVDENNRVNSQAIATICDLPYQIVLQWTNGTGTAMPIPPADPGQTHMTGFTFRRNSTGGLITLPMSIIREVDPDIHALRVSGYTSRPIPYGSTTQIAISDEEEYLVRAYCKSQGYDLLAHDRAMFAQWQGQTNNTDVSPTQLMQLAAGSAQSWDRMRGLNRVVRKYE
jgi:hypothetical protein